MIYTSYFAKLKSLPKNIIPISICGKAPNWYNGLQYKNLAPKYWFFAKYKENGDEEYYERCFHKEVLSVLNAKEIVDELNNLASNMNKDYEHICLICYEKPSNFCHRHLVSKWLRQNGFNCEEL